ncbi:MAG: efflux RND transporter periplasmic adaptor subunit, partial [Thiomicrospira sp.]
MKTMSKLMLTSSLIAMIGLSGCSQEASQETSETNGIQQTIKAPVETVNLGTIPLKA